MKINYFNEYMMPVSAKQANLLREYVKQVVIEDRIKSEETYNDGVLVGGTYFLDSGENINETRSKYEGIPLEIYSDTVNQGPYRKYNVNTFDADGSLANRSIVVLNENDDTIYRKVFSPKSIDFVYFEKTYFDSVNDVTYEFYYHQDGTFRKLSITDPTAFVDTDESEFGPNDIGIGKNPYDFTWDGFEYYQFAEPIIPN